MESVSSDSDVDVKSEIDDESMAVESVHTLLERRSLTHGLKNTKKYVGKHKLKQAKTLLDLFNAKNMRPKS